MAQGLEEVEGVVEVEVVHEMQLTDGKSGYVLFE